MRNLLSRHEEHTVPQSSRWIANVMTLAGVLFLAAGLLLGCRSAGNKEYHILIQLPESGAPTQVGQATAQTPATATVPAVNGQASGAVVVNLIDASYTYQVAPKTLEDVLNPTAAVSAPGSSASATAARAVAPSVADASTASPAPPAADQSPTAIPSTATPSAAPSPAPATP